MKKVAIIFNGGTISMKIDKKLNAAIPSLTNEEIMSMVTGIEEYGIIENYNFSKLPSPHMTIEMMLELSKFTQSIVDRRDIDAVVITHGTDTLEETAYFLDLTISTKKPIIVTGAMKSSSELGYDGPFNLANSICTAISDEAVDRGVLVCFNGTLHSAREVTKVNSMALDAFHTPSFGPIGIVDNNKVLFYRESQKSHVLSIDNVDAIVPLIKCTAGMESSYIEYLLKENNIDGIIIEGLGRGNVPPNMLDSISSCLKNNIPVVLVSRCYEGRVHESYGYEGGGKQLREMGVIFGDNMQGQKARIKLLVALSYNKDTKFIKEYMEEKFY
ncbi:asparaginase [Clostridium sp. MSJ-8]|uniref:asparaginase n=1 Tax=Clostridium sp. MSJ-8 TaxID=2841510 RepID=UPI001C0F3AAE|nr:asparaginase [Clostridium sp. MSJ-8]MBU5488611.1 asparaginase [Clostridium sp. MSJ-8]